MRHRFLAVFIIIVLFFSISTFLSIVQIRFMTSASFLNKFMTEAKVYENLQKLTESLLNSNKEVGLDTVVLSKAITKSLDPLETKDQFEKNSPLFIDYLKGKRKTLDVTFNTRNLKNYLSDNVPQIYLDEFQKLPPCQEGSEYEESKEITNCQPEFLSISDIETNINKNQSLNSYIENIPDDYKLSSMFKNGPDQVFAKAKLFFKLINIVFWISLVFSLILIGLLALLGRHYWPSILRWVGFGLMLPSLFSILIYLLGMSISFFLTEKYILNLNSLSQEIILPFINTLNKNAFKLSSIYAFSIFCLGLILFILSYALPHPLQSKNVVLSQKSPRKEI